MHSITVYTTGPTCMKCMLTIRTLEKKGIPYREVDITTHHQAREYVTEKLGYTQAPVCVVEDGHGHDHWSGYRPEHIARVLAH